jgi:hypothetical protein
MKLCKDKQDMLSMLLKLIQINDDVAQVGYAELIKMFTYHVVYMALEGHRSIDKAKRDNGVLVVTITCMKSSFSLVSRRVPGVYERPDRCLVLHNSGCPTGS